MKRARVYTMEEFFETNCCIRGYHVYKEAAVGEALVCEREPGNAHARSIRCGLTVGSGRPLLGLK